MLILLPVIFSDLSSNKLQISEKTNTLNLPFVYGILGFIRRHFTFLDKDSFLVTYKSTVRSHLEYPNCIWSPQQFKIKKCGEGPNESDKVNTRNQTSVIYRLKYFLKPSYFVTSKVKRGYNYDV